MTENAVRLIAKKAMAKNTGARGLRSILENVLMEAMFEVILNPSIYEYIYVDFIFSILNFYEETQEESIVLGPFPLVCLRFSKVTTVLFVANK